MLASQTLVPGFPCYISKEPLGLRRGLRETCCFRAKSPGVRTTGLGTQNPYHGVSSSSGWENMKIKTITQ